MELAKPEPTAEPATEQSINSRRSELAASEVAKPAHTTSQRVVRVDTVDHQSAHSIWQPSAESKTRSTSTSDAILCELRVAPLLSADIEAQLLDTLTRALDAGETHHEGGARREREVAALLKQLDERDAYYLHRRLLRDRDDDPIVIAFRRMVVERRQRLRGVLERRRRMLAGRR